MTEQKTENIAIEEQRKSSFNALPTLDIVDACKINNGILQFNEEQQQKYAKNYLAETPKTTFFIPASGSGSRMFQFLFDFLNEPNNDNQGKVERFINHFEELAFSKKINQKLVASLKKGEVSLDDFISYLLNEEGLNFGQLPKGLIPFHRIGPFILNPFQSHIAQGVEITPFKPNFHFTINDAFREEIQEEQNIIKKLIASDIEITYSVQNPDTDAYVFDDNQALVMDDNGLPFRRPSGHGALIENLNQIDSEIIFIKNIDNIQHYNKNATTQKTFQFLGGLVMSIDKERSLLIHNFRRDHFNIFNSKYEILLPSEINELTDEEIIATLNLPIRVCGMVKNEGEPGGGPFWLRKNGVSRKQIIEKAQINSKNKQYNLLINSTHFNPVIMALKNADIDGNKFELTQHIDSEQYFNVKKSQKGKNVFFTERPGLWNGGMYDWLTIFVEIPSETFSPVKTILDLLQPIHLEK